MRYTVDSTYELGATGFLFELRHKVIDEHGILVDVTDFFQNCSIGKIKFLEEVEEVDYELVVSEVADILANTDSNFRHMNMWVVTGVKKDLASKISKKIGFECTKICNNFILCRK